MRAGLRCAVVLGALLPFAAPVARSVAAPVCAVTGSARNCWYGSLASCLSAVGHNGACVMNQEEAAKQSGSAPFCVVGPNSLSCTYYSFDTCQRAALSQGGICDTRRR